MARLFFFKSITALITTAMAFVVMTSAAAQPARCATRQHIVDWLVDGFDERQAAIGLMGSRALVELFVSPGGSWTILVTDPTGWSCMVASGQRWVAFETPLTQTGLRE